MRRTMEEGMRKGLISVIFLCFYGLAFLRAFTEARCECMHKLLPLLRPDDYRVLMSPEFPRPYCSELNCIWHVIAPDNSSKIHFFSKNIDLRSDKDFINFYETAEGMENELSNPLHSCTGSGHCQFKSTGQFLIVQFKTAGGEPDHYGFQGTVALYDREFQSLGFFVVALISVGVTVVLLGIIYLAFLRNKNKEINRKLLAKEDEESKPMRNNYLKP